MLYSNMQRKQCSKTPYQILSDNCHLQCKIRQCQQDSYGAPSITDSGSSKFLKCQEMAVQHLLTGELTSITWNYRWQAQNKQKESPKTMWRKYALSPKCKCMNFTQVHRKKKPGHIHGRLHPQPPYINTSSSSENWSQKLLPQNTFPVSPISSSLGLY